MPLATLHALSVEQRSLTLSFTTARATRAPQFVVRIELQRGWVHGVFLERLPLAEGPDPTSAAELRERERALLAAIAPGLAREADGPTRLQAVLVEGLRAGLAQLPADDEQLGRAGRSWLRREPGAPFHPLRALRATIDELLAGGDADSAERAVRANAIFDARAQRSLRLRSSFHASALDPDEQSAAQLLSTPLGWDELLARSRCTPARLLRLLRDAAVLGALEADGLDEMAPRLLSVLAAPAQDEAVRRRAYHAQARAVHPDLRPEADDAERKARTDAMADLATRHRRGE